MSFERSCVIGRSVILANHSGGCGTEICLKVETRSGLTCGRSRRPPRPWAAASRWRHIVPKASSRCGALPIPGRTRDQWCSGCAQARCVPSWAPTWSRLAVTGEAGQRSSTESRSGGSRMAKLTCSRSHTTVRRTHDTSGFGRSCSRASRLPSSPATAEAGTRLQPKQSVRGFRREHPTLRSLRHFVRDAAADGAMRSSGRLGQLARDSGSTAGSATFGPAVMLRVPVGPSPASVTLLGCLRANVDNYVDADARRGS